MKILYFTYNRIPDGDAGAIRDMEIAKLLANKGHEIIIIGMGDSNFKEFSVKGNIKYLSLRMNKSGFIEKVKNYYGMSKRFDSISDELIENFGAEVFIIVNLPINFLIKLKKIAQRKKIQLIHDAVEWYSPSQFKLNIFSPEFVKKEVYNRLLIDRKFNVISISNYLNNHFIDRNIQSVRVPIFFEKNTEFQKKDLNNIVHFIYAGSPGRKDYIYTILNNFSELKKNGITNFYIHLVGLTEVDVKSEGIDLDKYSLFDNIKFYGRVTKKEVEQIYKKTHFSLLLRDSSKRYSKAGFPTKVVESWKYSTPVISNLTSDLNLYLTSDKNGIIINDESDLQIYHALDTALKIDSLTYKELNKKSFQTYCHFFTSEVYSNTINNILLSNIKKKSKKKIFED